MNLDIRPEQPLDDAAIDTVILAAFAASPYSSHTEHEVVRKLRAAGALAQSLVARLDGQVVGHVAFSPLRIADGSEGWWGLGPIAVNPVHQGLGIGGALMLAGLEGARAAQVGGCVVLGDPAFYGRFGFAPDPDLVLAGVPPEFFQVRRLRDAHARGEVFYHPAFDGA
ncbi:GNAT family N-acetyltransferase [Bordetella genomosp. 1]|uniref:GNAT family N-acetyltransferase n=1 Tax=Bordetella genomosp. 1 TaxID=1395607 RepID=A0ABX4EXQ8_9BORD|nr:N-acetyltransferase [Bordetella genomosp. 1]OZI63863.1 GNAT family N-acetyltransferase [Bordetella genomosp. 1]